MEINEPVSATPPPRRFSREVPCWTIEWDGSFNGTKAGTALVLRIGEMVVLEAPVPAYASHTSRCEALDPTLATLLLSRAG